MMNPWRVARPFDSFERRHQLFLVLFLTVTALAIADRAVAQTSEPDAHTLEFNIPAQSVPAALSEFARQARVQLFFISDGFENIQANAVVGIYATQDALDLLLAGTGLLKCVVVKAGCEVAVLGAARMVGRFPTVAAYLTVSPEVLGELRRRAALGGPVPRNDVSIAA